MLGLVAIIAGPMLATTLGMQTRDYPTGWLICLWMVLIVIHDKLTGRLVPAVCWGLFAMQDDDRLPARGDSMPVKEA